MNWLRVRNLPAAAWLWPAPLAFLALFYLYPLAGILQASFVRAGNDLAAPFIEAISSASIMRTIGFTFWQAALSTLLTLLFGLPGAYLLARYRFRGKSLLQALAGIPFVLPTLVVAAAFNALLGPRGWLNLLLMNILGLAAPPIQFVNTLTAILTAHVFYNTTIVLRMVGDFWARLDPRLAQVARVSGASRWQTMRYVTLPLLAPAIAAAALLIFIFDFTSFGVVLVLGGPRFATLEVEIFYQTVGLFNLPLAAALSMIQLACTLSLTILYSRLSVRLSRPLSLKPQQITQQSLHSWPSRLMAIGIVTALLGLLTLPLVALLTRSLVVVDINSQIPGEWLARPTLAFYQELWINRQSSYFYAPPTTAILVSLSYAITTVILALGLGLPASWALARRPGALSSRLIDPLIMLPLGTSAVTLGLGFIVTFNRPPLNLSASPLLIPFAHTLVAFPFVVRSLTPALRSIRPQLRQAASVLGATPWRVFLAIDLPLIGRALIVAATFAFTISVGEFGATALLSRPEYPTIPVVIYRFISQPGALNYGQALALSTILMVFTTTGMLMIEKLRLADIGEF